MSVLTTMVDNLQHIGFFDIVLPWLFTLAIVYGMLDHYDIPDSSSARGAISLALAFFVLPIGVIVGPFFQNLLQGFLVIVGGILVAVIFVEMLGYKTADMDNIFLQYPRVFGLLLTVLAVIVFVGAGGLDIIGIGNNGFTINNEIIGIAFFLGLMSIAVWSITREE